MARYEFGASGTKAPPDWDAKGGGAADVAAAFLRSLGYANVFTAPPAARVCADPVVLTCTAWEREARLADGCERGAWTIDVLTCCEDPRDAEATACALERDVRRGDWDGAGDGWHVRVVACDTGAPEPRGRDGSGRWLWGFAMILTIARDFHE